MPMSVTELLSLRACLNCGRSDRLAVKAWRSEFFIECDCGTVAGRDRDFVVAVNWWNLTPHFTPNAGIKCQSPEAQR